MWCLEQLCLGPERLLRRGDWLLRGRARRSTAARPTAFANVLTPDRIPEFCIPPRLAPSPGPAALRNSWGEEWGTDEGAGRTDWDPRSQAALSLPHLPRARTAYGFCALLESPHTPRAVGCRVSFVLRPRGQTRRQRSAVVRRSRNPVFDQDFCFDGLTEDEVRRLAVRVKAGNKGRGLERGRLLGQGELLLGSLLLL
ncbi:C2 calcium-dependent domain-containing protein 4A [Trichechus manatus latirostris]|uniref:C2 calcium-dependent domain-containing protein 4A n=1 Tax=Trichechus manatus latirostris TaxID=127582 RepID=A0A2Y9DI55_TRIMA|nr:C2 calcium-dependent domain-containing protein 4A [Trichechus manatus latirostris]